MVRVGVAVFEGTEVLSSGMIGTIQLRLDTQSNSAVGKSLFYSF